MTSILAVDASSTYCSVALSDQGQRWYISEQQPRKQAQRLLPMVAELFTQSGVSKQAVEGIAYGRGPGSFTGIRIAASVTQGLALALEVPVYAVSSLQALALQAFRLSSANEVIVLMNAHMGEVFWGRFARQGELCISLQAERVGTAVECLADIAQAPALLMGDALLLAEFADQDQTWAEYQPQAVDILTLALAAFKEGLFGPAEAQQPVYLRESVAWKKLSEQPSLLKLS